MRCSFSLIQRGKFIGAGKGMVDPTQKQSQSVNQCVPSRARDTDLIGDDAVIAPVYFTRDVPSLTPWSSKHVNHANSENLRPPAHPL